jgi:hypothetical protein
MLIRKGTQYNVAEIEPCVAYVEVADLSDIPAIDFSRVLQLQSVRYKYCEIPDRTLRFHRC